MTIATFSRTLARLPHLETFLAEPIKHLWLAEAFTIKHMQAVAGWGFRPSTRIPQYIAKRAKLPFLRLEDGFLRSYAPGRAYASISMVVDREGIYYAADQPSALESLLASNTNILEGAGRDYDLAKEQIIAEGLSKYNHAPDIPLLPTKGAASRILVVDQTRGDASVAHGMASAATFTEMYKRALNDNPRATIYIKTHPQVSSGEKKGYLSDVRTGGRTVLLREPASAKSLLTQMDKVYVVTSQLGFEALLYDRPVFCFGMPWYAGWGLTQDALRCSRRSKQRTVDELFAAAYMHYTRYINPQTGLPGTIFDAINWLSYQRKMHHSHKGRTIAVGYRRWKAENIRPFLGNNGKRIHFARNADDASRLAPTEEDRVLVWGSKIPEAIETLVQTHNCKLVRMEDGFIRSVGLGSDFIPPAALVFDSRGLYFDPRTPSDLEIFLNTHEFSDEELDRARAVQGLIVTHGLTKYNVEPNSPISWAKSESRVLLVPGQVEDDASIRYGCTNIRTNLQLLETVRTNHPNAFIVYKPHPDVVANNRNGHLHSREALKFADIIEDSASIVSCIEAADEIHTMTSLSGFDGLLRNKDVTTYGLPFYAGWGLTQDQAKFPRPRRKLHLHELIAGALLYYPVYYDTALNGYTTCEGALCKIIRDRNRLLAKGQLTSVRQTHWRRQWIKVALWAKAGFLVTR